MIVGLIADTHGLLRPEAVAALAGSDFIVHAGDIGDIGDIGDPGILGALATIAPVTAVRGNIDKGAWASALPDRAVLEVGAVSIYVLHILADLDLDPAAAGFQVVVSGHSHQPGFETRRGGVLYVNPGSAGPRRFRLPVTIGRLVISGTSVTPQIVEIV